MDDDNSDFCFTRHYWCVGFVIFGGSYVAHIVCAIATTFGFSICISLKTGNIGTTQAGVPAALYITTEALSLATNVISTLFILCKLWCVRPEICVTDLH